MSDANNLSHGSGTYFDEADSNNTWDSHTHEHYNSSLLEDISAEEVKQLTLDANFFAELLNNDSSIEHLMHGFVPVNNGETSVEISDTSNSQLNDSTDSQIDCSSLFIYSEDKNNENNLINDNFDEAMILDSAPNKEINIIVQELEQNAQLAVAAAAATQHTQDVLPSDSQSAELEASVRRKIENIKNEQKKTRFILNKLIAITDYYEHMKAMWERQKST